ncbi:MAG: dihydrodipicolinate synthase family protein [Cyclobacteriaceae bacterium]|nr:dihydrodipicolinate synthase family protein [Cyclobacteriaceae bacterium]
MNWTGVFPAITTKFHEDESIDYASFEKNLQFQIESGIHGVILGGSLGETSTLGFEEKLDLLKFTIKSVNNKIPVILNIAEQRTADAVKMAREGEKLGANGFMLLPPMRYFADSHETVEFFSAVAKNTDLPIMIYNNPVDYKIHVTLEMFETLSKYPNINAVKESTRDTTNITRMINHFGDRFSILCGVDTIAVESLVMGANGWVAGLVDAFPRETVVIYELVKANRIQEAIEIFRWFLPLLELDIFPKLVQYIKLAETKAGVGTEFVRAPRLRIEGEERKRIENIIDKALAVRPTLPKI